MSVQARVRAVFKATDFLQADVDTLADDADLYAAGLNSHATVNLMLSLEEAFDVRVAQTDAAVRFRVADR